jgi:aryl-alcohol dehydrogenase-like predicted oxidoreductase
MNQNAVPLGKTGISIPPLGIGTWSWGDYMFWGYGKGYLESDVQAAFNTCMQAGVNFFDTAEVYGLGRSEEMLGRFLKADGRPALVATKFFPFPFRLARGSLHRALRGSLRRLQMSQVALYQIHQPIPPIPVSTWMNAMADALQQGKIRSVGVSNYSPAWTLAAHDSLKKRGLVLASNQVSYSLVNRDPERSGLVELCRELGITIIAYSPLGMGMLSGKYTPENPPKDFRKRRYSPEFLRTIQPLIHLLREIGQGRGGKTNSQVALNWLIQKGAVPIPGVKNEQQARDVIGCLGWSLTAGEVEALDNASKNISRNVRR